MGHYIRVLATDAAPIAVDDLKSCLPSNRKFEIVVDTEGEAGWSQLALRHVSGPDIAVIEKDDVIAGKLGADEIAEFTEEIGEAQPVSASRWLAQYLPRVRVIYAFQILDGANVDDGWTPVHALRGHILKKRSWISQADGEGFSNEDGYHILWQFSDHVDGDWSMAVLDERGRWIRFKMDLGNREQRAAFRQGHVPKGAQLL